jgi:hypothetical protein
MYLFINNLVLDKMITREKLEEILDDDSKRPFQEKEVDYKMKALTLLREKIPYDVCGGIIVGAEHDQIYLCDLYEVLPYIDEDDAKILADCNLFIDSDCGCLSMFV